MINSALAILFVVLALNLGQIIYKIAQHADQTFINLPLVTVLIIIMDIIWIIMIKYLNHATLLVRHVLA
jgi:hypothetical protein